MVQGEKSVKNKLNLSTESDPQFVEMDLAISCSHGDDHQHWAHSFPFYLLSAYFQKAILFTNRNELGTIQNKTGNKNTNGTSKTSDHYLKLKRFDICRDY